MSKNVKLYYGPYESNGIVKYKIQRFFVIKDTLEDLGFRVTLIRMKEWDFCVLKINDKEVFRCKISNLGFNSLFKDDVVSRRAICAVKTACQMMEPPDTFFWIRRMLEVKMNTTIIKRVTNGLAPNE